MYIIPSCLNDYVVFKKTLNGKTLIGERWICQKNADPESIKSELLEMANRWDSLEKSRINPDETGAECVCLVSIGSDPIILNQPRLDSWETGANLAFWIIENKRDVEEGDRARRGGSKEREAEFYDKLWKRNAAGLHTMGFWHEQERLHKLDCHKNPGLSEARVDTQVSPDGTTWYFYESLGTWLEDPPQS